MLVAAPVSSRKTSFCTFSSACSPRQISRASTTSARSCRQRAQTFFERQVETAQPVPQAPRAHLDLAGTCKPGLELGQRGIRMLADLGAKGLVMRRKLRLASSPAGARLRLARLRASAQSLVDVRNAYPEHRGGSINSHSTIDRRHYSLTQILGVRSSHRDPRLRIRSRIRNHRTVRTGTPQIPLNVNLL